jgi:hypothetical protein
MGAAPANGAMLGGGIGVEDAGPSGVDGLEAELGYDGPVESLIGAGEDDEALTIGEVEELGDVAEIELGQVRQRGPEDEAESTAG